MSGHLREAVLAALAAGLLALALASCVARTAPEAAYEDKLEALDATGLMRERRTLKAEEEAVLGRMAETRAGDLPETAKEAALRSLGESQERVRARLAAVEQVLRSGSFVRHEVRYKVLDLTRRAEASQAAERQAPAPPAVPEAAAPAKRKTPPASAAQAAAPVPTQPAPMPAATATAAEKTPPAPPAQSAAQATPRPASPEPPAARPAAPAAQSAPTAPPAAPKPMAQAPTAVAGRPAPAAQAATSAGPARLLGVEMARSGSGITVTVRLSAAAGHRLFTLNTPPRIVLDVTGLEKPGIPLPARTLDWPEARALRLGWHPESATLRLVLDTDAAHLGRVRVEPAQGGLLLVVEP